MAQMVNMDDIYNSFNRGLDKTQHKYLRILIPIMCYWGARGILISWFLVYQNGPAVKTHNVSSILVV